MIHALSPQEAQELIATGTLDVVDVREPDEFASGHVPGARNAPLGDVKNDPKRRLPRDGVLLICARGMRSATAAGLAESLGYTSVHHLDGGTHAWAAVGLPLEHPPAPSQPRRTEPTAKESPEAASCGLPEPGLDVVVGANMHTLRTRRNLTLDQLARLTGLSRTVLGQIELGKTPPSVSMVWRIAQAFQVPFSALLSTSDRQHTRVLRAGEAKRLVSPDGRFSSRALYPFEERPPAEFYELHLSPHSREDAQAHQSGTRENLVVTKGRLELVVGAEQYELGTGDAIVFTADVPHAYVNPGSEPCVLYLVMTYASPS